MLSFFIPTAYAATVESIIRYTIDEAVQPFIWLLMFVASVVFIWGVIEFISNADNGNKRSEGIKHMIWGVIGLFVMSAAAGILWVLVRFWNDID